MQAIIEKQLKKAFLEKINLEWPACIDYYVFPEEDLAVVYLLPGIDPGTFHQMLLPKAGAFADFSSPLKATFVDSEGSGSRTVCFNCGEMERQPTTC